MVEGLNRFADRMADEPVDLKSLGITVATPAEMLAQFQTLYRL
jgi:hypothetical protein